MGRVRLFEHWTFSRPLPEPFGKEADRIGKKDSTKVETLSVHNRMRRGKRSTLHAPTLKALKLLAEIVDGKGAAGYQLQDEKVRYYCMETVKDNTVSKEVCVIVYDRTDGICKGIVQNGSTRSGMPQFGERGTTAKELLAIMGYASITDGPLHDKEFASNFLKFKQELGRQTDMEALMNLAFLLCDNLYRRIENADALGEAGIPFHSTTLDTGNIPVIIGSRLENGFYSPDVTEYGAFTVLKEGKRKQSGTIGALKSTYNRGFSLTEKEKELIPALPETYEVPQEAIEIVEAVCSTPMRVFMSAGDAGTGKSTNAKIIAQLLGMPYYFFTCGEATDEVDLVSSMVPNIRSEGKTEEISYPTFKDMVMDPASALERITGDYEEDIDAEHAFKKILESLYKEGLEKGRQEKDFCLMESSIVTGCRRPSVIEIQEPSVIAKPGTLVKLNGLLDEGASITLASGEVVHRDPDTVILLTTNMDYKGCRGFNESVLSRMRMLQFLEPLTAQAMVERVLKKVKFPDHMLLKQMADVVCEIQRYCKTEMITGGVCGYREFEDWVWAYLVQKDVCNAAKRTIIAKAAPEKEDREELYRTQIKTRFSEKKAA